MQQDFDDLVRKLKESKTADPSNPNYRRQQNIAFAALDNALLDLSANNVPTIKSPEFLEKGDRVFCISGDFPEKICLVVRRVDVLSRDIEVDGGTYGIKTVPLSGLRLINEVNRRLLSDPTLLAEVE